MGSRNYLIVLFRSPIFIVISLVASALLLALTLAFFLLAKIFAAIFCLIVFLCIVLPLIRLRKGYQKEKYSELGNVIFNYITKKGIKHLALSDFQEEYNVSEKNIMESAKVAYKHCVKLAMKDYKVTEGERKILDVIAAKLEIEKHDALGIEKEFAKNIYRKELDKALSNGRLTENESKLLERVRSQLGLTMKEAYEGSQKEIIEGYKKLFNRFAKDGILSVDECDELLIYSKTTGLDCAHAAQLAHGESRNLYRRTVSIVCQDGIITEEETAILDRLEKLLKIPGKIVKLYRSEVIKTQELEKIRKGKLPNIRNHGLQLNYSEFCRWRSACRYHYQTTTQQREASGILAITDRRLIFLSDTKNFEMSIRRIINFRQYTDGIDIQFTSNRGKGFYKLKNSEKLEAILESLTKKINYIISENSDSVRSRHIPDSVKVEIWQRDQGVCIKCGTDDFLEYDHIIPFSKGGANTVNNIQLLCRKCNLSKGAEII